MVKTSHELEALEKLKTQQTNGTQKTLLVGANDINGGTPHRHLTVDGNGRLLTIPYEHPSSWTNTHLTSIRDNTAISRTQGILFTNEAFLGSTTHASNIDCRTKKSIRVFGSTSTTDEFYIVGSQDDTNYYRILSITPNMDLSFSGYIENAPPYIKVKSGNAISITLHYSLLN